MTFDTKVTFHYLGNEPSEANACWDEDAQGLCHDDNHWFFSRQNLIVKMTIEKTVARDDGEAVTDIPDPLWNYHQTHGLGQSLDSYVGSGYVIRSARYDHFGDIDYFDGYIFVAMTGTAYYRDANADTQGTGMPPILAVFRAADLSFVGWDVLTEQSSAGWCAINPRDGRVYTSGKLINTDEPLRTYRINWQALADTGRDFLEFDRTVSLQVEYTLRHMQGGCFGPQRYLFLTNGYGTDFNVSRGGIHVFDMDRGGALVEHSSQSGEGLRFQFDPTTPKWEEPEGITWWDLDLDERAPRISGQLHAVMLDNDYNIFEGEHDDIYIKHYRVKDVIERAPYLVHELRREQMLPTEGAHVLDGLRDLMIDAHWRTLLSGHDLVRAPRDADLVHALTTGEGVHRLALASALDGAGLDPTRTPLGLAAVDGHIWIPIGGGDPAVLVLADGLSTVGVWTPPDGEAVAWVAINPRSRELYAGARASSRVRRFRVDYDRIHRTGEIVTTALDGLGLVDAVGRSRTVERIGGACVVSEGDVLYLAEPGGLWAFAVRDGRAIDASHDEMLELGKGPSFGGRPQTGEASFGVATWRDGADPIVETLLRQPNGSYVWAQFVRRPSPGSLGVGFIGNRRSKEVHKRHCLWVRKMNDDNKVFFDSVLTATEQGYDGCGTCLRIYNTG